MTPQNLLMLTSPAQLACIVGFALFWQRPCTQHNRKAGQQQGERRMLW
jgi:hypothetical protein